MHRTFCYIFNQLYNIINIYLHLLQMLLMERSRAGRRNETSEYGFNVFSYLMAGADIPLQRELGLDSNMTEVKNMFVTSPMNTEEKSKFSIKFSKLVQSFSMLKVEPCETRIVWSILAAIVHLGYAGITTGKV